MIRVPFSTKRQRAQHAIDAFILGGHDRFTGERQVVVGVSYARRDGRIVRSETWHFAEGAVVRTVVGG